MARLEYRLLEEANNYPLLYYYADIDRTEIAARLACDYFVKDAVTYEKTSGAMDINTYVIYVQKAEIQDNISATPPGKNSKLRLELRQFIENSSYYPEIAVFEPKDNLEALLYLQCDFHYWLGQEWRKTSAELDEDRKVYIIYASPMV